MTDPLYRSLRWLSTLIESPAVPWDAEQRAAALADLQAALGRLAAEPAARIHVDHTAGGALHVEWLTDARPHGTVEVWTHG